MSAVASVASEPAAQYVQNLPPLPAVAQEILLSLGDEFIDGNRVADIVEKDPGICARLLGLANSAYFGVGRPVSDMREVVNRVLGVDTVRSLAFALASKQVLNTSACPAFDASLFWHRAVTCASSSKRIASVLDEVTPVDREFAYALGLCHNLGLMAFVHYDPNAMDEVLSIDRGESKQALSELLKERFGCSAEALTCELARQWQLPEQIVEAYAYRADTSNTQSSLALILRAGIRAAQFEELDPGTQETGEGADWFNDHSEPLGLSPKDLQSVAVATERQREAAESAANCMSGAP